MGYSAMPAAESRNINTDESPGRYKKYRSRLKAFFKNQLNNKQYKLYKRS